MTTKSILQPMLSTSTPESVGPTAGAKPITSETKPIALPRFSRGKMSRSTVKIMGMKTPAAIAWHTRPSSRKMNPGENAQSKLPAVKIIRPVMKS